MITDLNKQKLEDFVEINIGRPDLIPNENMIQWREFHNWIAECDIPIIPSGAYWNIIERISQNQGFMGGGFQYMFWFKNNKDKEIFEDKLMEIFND